MQPQNLNPIEPTRNPIEPTNKGHRILVLLLTILLTAGAIGGGVYYVLNQQNKAQQKLIEELQKENKSNTATEKDEAKKTETLVTKEDEINKGFIEGSLTYPSSDIPADMEVYAEDTVTKKTYKFSGILEGNQYTYKKGYKIEVPAGNYFVYGVIKSNQSQKAYYNKFITCGMSVDCTDTTKIVISVKVKETVSGIMVGDWWNQQGL